MNPALMLLMRALAAAPTAGVEYIGLTASTADATEYTLAAVPIGAATSDRVLILGVFARQGTPITSVTVGGISATKISGATAVELWQVAVPTGTTATVVVTASATATGCAVAVWSITGYTVGVTAANFSKLGNASTPIATTAGGCVIEAAYVALASTRTTLVGVAEDFDQAAADISIAGGHAYPTEADTLTVGGNPTIRIAVASLSLTAN